MYLALPLSKRDEKRRAEEIRAQIVESEKFLTPEGFVLNRQYAGLSLRKADSVSDVFFTSLRGLDVQNAVNAVLSGVERDFSVRFVATDSGRRELYLDLGRISIVNLEGDFDYLGGPCPISFPVAPGIEIGVSPVSLPAEIAKAIVRGVKSATSVEYQNWSIW